MATVEQKYEVLFNKLDVNKDGRIDMRELRAAMKSAGLKPDAAQQFFERSDANMDKKIDMGEFVNYMVGHEKEILLVFSSLDRNRDGKIDEFEIMTSFKDLGIDINKQEANRLLQRLDKNHTLKIEWNEFRDFLLFQSLDNIQDILKYWRHSTIIDIGENALIPDDFTEKEMQSGLWWRQLVAGGVAGMVSRTATAPLDRLKVLFQVHGSSQGTSIVRSFKGMVEEGGWRSLWRGNGMNVVKIAPESALKFMAYEQIKTLIKGESNREIGIIERLLSGSLAGATAQTIIYPMEVMKTRLAIRKTGQYKGMLDCAIKLYQNEGAKCFYRGYLPNILGIIPYAGIDLAIYETLKNAYSKQYDNSDPGILVLLGCGTTSSTCGQLASYPLALVRTRLQAQAAISSGTKDTMGSMFSNILHTEGFFGLYRGIAPNFLKVAPAVSIGYVIYEQCRRQLGINK